MSKAGLSNNLLGKLIEPKPEYGDPADVNQPNARFWAGLKPNLSGQWFATIDAAWVEEGNVRLAVHDTLGNTKETSLTFHNLKPEATR